MPDTSNKQPVQISKRCITGFVMSCLGLISAIVFKFAGPYIDTNDMWGSVLILISIWILISFIVSVGGVADAFRYHKRFRVLGVFGTVISGVILSIVLLLFLAVIFHESPPQPPPSR